MYDRAHQLDTLLLRHQTLWRPRPFAAQHQPAWLGDHPRLAEYLLSLDDTAVERLQGDDDLLLTQLAPHFPDAAAIATLLQTIPVAIGLPAQEPPAGIPGRKWQQIRAFLAAQTPAANQLVEWCAGKGYLGEALCDCSGAPVTSLEIDPTLVAAGNHRARQRSQHRRSLQCDVLSDDLSPYLNPDTGVLALHACGGLHQQLLRSAVQHRCASIGLSPCCYHRYCDHYRPLSQFYRQSTLQLDAHTLRLAVRQTTTARRGETRARRTLQAWQLAFRELLAQHHHPAPAQLPSLPMHWAQTGFEAYCQQLCQLLERPPLPTDEGEDAIAKGWQTLQRIERLQLLPMAFRRLLELRCVTDSQLYLQEQGYRTALTQFCSPALTPRNLLLTAQRAH